MTSASRYSPAVRPVAGPRVYFILLVGIIAVSLASIFIRFAQDEGVPSLVIAAGRVTIAALILTPWVLSRNRATVAGLPRRSWLLSMGAGFFLAAHFASWISSLEYTSVLISVVFVTTNPLWVALLEAVFFRVRPSRWVALGLVMALAGGILIGVAPALSGQAVNVGAQPVLGAGLALLGAITFACYLVIGREVRARLPLVPYIWLVYGWAAVFLLVGVALAGLPVVGYSTGGYFWLFAMAIMAQLVGHTSFNYALAYLSATFIGIATQMESIGSAVAAYLIFDEVPLPLQIVGSAFILAGVGLTSWAQGKPAPAARRDEAASG
jgi:drug/metabolite transporter (DMT)-like permease